MCCPRAQQVGARAPWLAEMTDFEDVMELERPVRPKFGMAHSDRLGTARRIVKSCLRPRDGQPLTLSLNPESRASAGPGALQSVHDELTGMRPLQA
jgi:hypothetical protein